MTLPLTETIEELIQPIMGDHPCGPDLKYDERFATLKNEINKLTGASPGAPKWETIDTLSYELLKVSKDLNLVAYISMNWIHKYRDEGLIAALMLLSGMLREHWEDIYPTKVKSRKIAFKFLQEKLNEQASKPENQCKNRTYIDLGIEASNGIKEMILNNMDDPPVNFKGIRNRLLEWQKQAPLPTTKKVEPKQESPQVVQPDKKEQVNVPTPSPSSPPQQNHGTQIQVEELAEGASLDQVFENLEKAAIAIYKEEPQNLMACTLNRLRLWNNPTVPKIEFPDPDDFKVTALENMRKASEWVNLFSRVEGLFLESWFWLDLQFYAVLAAEGMERPDLQETIERLTMQLDQRFPELKEKKFTNTPFASSETKDWLNTLPQKLSGSGEVSLDPADEVLSELRKLGKDGFEDALKLAQTKIDGAVDRRQAFKMRVKVAKYCLEIDQVYWALSLAKGLTEELSAHQLTYWEPKLAAEAWLIILSVSRELMETDKDYYEEWETKAMQQLSILDLGTAGKFTKNRPTY